MLRNAIISRARIDAARRARHQVGEIRSKEQRQLARSGAKFHQNLALLSGGTVALSITYLGFLKTLTDRPSDLMALKLSWVMLFTCLVSATFFQIFNANHLHYGRGREYAERWKAELETLANEAPVVGVQDLNTKEELDAYIKESRDAAAKLGDGIRWNHKRENFNRRMFRACRITANISFVVGMALLLVFGLANINLANTRKSSAPESKTQSLTE